MPDSPSGTAAARYGLARGESNADDAADLLSALTTVCLLAVIYAGWSGTFRTSLLLVFTFFIPGRAVVTNWRGLTPSPKFALPIVFSLGILTSLAMISLWLHAWAPLALFQAEAWLSIFGLSAGVIRRHVERAVPREGEENG